MSSLDGCRNDAAPCTTTSRAASATIIGVSVIGDAWEDSMELRRLRYFVAVAEELHFRRAAQRLHLAQPALSQQVRKLELELGVDLLHRTKRGVALTPAGAIFLGEAKLLLRHADEAARSAREARSGKTGRLRLGRLADAVPAVIPRAIAAFASRYPGIEIVPETVQASRAVEEVRAGRLDVALVGLPVAAEGLKVVRVAREGAVAAVADRHALSGRSSIPVAALGAHRLVLLPRATNPAFHDAVLGACRTADVAPALIDTAEPNVEHALLLVASGLGVAVLPASVADRYAIPGISFRPLEPPAPTLELGAVVRAELSEAAVEGFIRLLGELDSRPRAVPALRSLEATDDARQSA
jgi:DNA-binding transcriptional LysR family regulator